MSDAQDLPHSPQSLPQPSISPNSPGSSRGSSHDHPPRVASTDTTTPLAAVLRFEKPDDNPQHPLPAASKPVSKFHIKSFQEVIDENEARARERAGKPDPWISRKFAIGLVAGILGWTSYVVIGRICIPMLHRTSRAGSRGRGIAFLAVFGILLLFFVWSYTKVVLTSPGYAKDYVPPFQIPTEPYHSHLPSYPPSSSTPSSNSTPPIEMDERPPSPRPTNPLPLPPTALPHLHPTSASTPTPASEPNFCGGICSPPLLEHRRAQEAAVGEEQEGEWVQRFPFEPEVHGRWCEYCEILKPERSHHCRMCGTCVLNMDHHCPWIGTCVGQRNHKFFLNFNIFSTLLTVFTLIVSAVSLRGSNNDPMIISIIILSVLFTGFTASMTWTHTTLILLNMSTIENIKVANFRERESAALQRRHGFWPTAAKRANMTLLTSQWGSPYIEGNPFWLGKRRNWTAVMGEEGWTWFLPLGGARDGTRGERYERNERVGRERGEWVMRGS